MKQALKTLTASAFGLVGLLAPMSPTVATAADLVVPVTSESLIPVTFNFTALHPVDPALDGIQMISFAKIGDQTDIRPRARPSSFAGVLVMTSPRAVSPQPTRRQTPVQVSTRPARQAAPQATIQQGLGNVWLLGVFR